MLLIVDGGSCPLGELARLATWLGAQSTRQCGPCRFGLPALASDVAALAAGDGEAAAARHHARAVAGGGACYHPDGAARLVTPGLSVIRDEIDVHLAHGGCGRPVRGLLGVPA